MTTRISRHSRTIYGNQHFSPRCDMGADTRKI
jgi:hypothetical protein